MAFEYLNNVALDEAVSGILAALEERGVRAAAVEAVSAAYRRTVELGK